MNKRQWKKRYKKLHGANPPTLGQVEKWETLLPEAVDKLFIAVKKMISDAVEITKDIVKRIREMPDDEFEDSFEKLDPDQKKLAWKIRFGGENESSNQVSRK